jgi:4-hydroxy-2-oxoheptanedioate aldolase
MPAELKRRIAAGETVIAVNPGGANPDIAEALARFGADVLFVDCERTGIGLDTAASLLRSAQAAGLPAIVRSWSPDPAVLVQFLDRQAGGIIVPRVDSAAEAASVVETVRYACGEAAPDRLTVIQIESRASVEAIDELAAVEGVDVFLIGPNDLAYSMTGTRGRRTAEVEKAIDHVAARLRAAGRRFGMPARRSELDTFGRRGATFLYYPLEWLLEAALSDLKERLTR